MRILVKFPSRGRPEKLKTALNLYISKAVDMSRIFFMITLDSDDETAGVDFINSLTEIHPHITVRVGISGTKVKAINRDMEFAPFYDILLLASDDMLPEIHGYDDIIRSSMHKYYPNTDGVLWFNDGIRGNELNTLCILGKKYYERFGYIYYPEYKSFYCDNEFMETADRLGKQTYIDMVIIRHVHVTRDLSLDDNTYRMNNVYANEDEKLYLQRKAPASLRAFLKRARFPVKRIL